MLRFPGLLIPSGEATCWAVALPSGPTLLEWRLVLRVLWVLPE